MNLDEIEIIPNYTIVLGIFGEKTFNIINDRGAKGYGEFLHIFPQYPDVISTVKAASIWAKKIIFVLDGVIFPINIFGSITCAELSLICQNDELFNKTVFVKGDDIINFDKNLL